MDFKMYMSLFFSVISIIVVLVLTYYGSKWVSKRYSSTAGTKHIKIIDRVMIGQDKFILVADIYNSKYIIGVSGQQITLLKDMGEVDIPQADTTQTEDFATIFSGMLKKQIIGVKDKFVNKGGEK